jgi:hypothetical protein
MELVGNEVEAHGLVGRADLNGQRGRVSAFVEEKGRCAVRFGTADSVLIKPDNLRLPAIDVSDAAATALDPPGGGEEALIAEIQKLRLVEPQATFKELHATLVAGEWSSVSLGDVKKAASKATKRSAQSASAVPIPVSGASKPVKEPPRPFEVGSVVTDTHGRKLKVVKSKADGVVSVKGAGQQRIELPQNDLILIDTPHNTCPRGYDLIVQSPRVGAIDQCDTLAEGAPRRALCAAAAAHSAVGYVRRLQPALRWLARGARQPARRLMARAAQRATGGESIH